MTKAFDTVSILQLTSYIYIMSLYSHTLFILRLTSKNGFTTSMVVKHMMNFETNGRNTLLLVVPQGGVIAPALLNLYMSDLPPTPPSRGNNVVSYADYCSVLTTGKDINELCNNINRYFHQLSVQLLVNKQKTCNIITKIIGTLFTTWINEVKPVTPIHTSRSVILTLQATKVLCENFDKMLTFNM